MKWTEGLNSVALRLPAKWSESVAKRAGGAQVDLPGKALAPLMGRGGLRRLRPPRLVLLPLP